MENDIDTGERVYDRVLIADIAEHDLDAFFSGDWSSQPHEPVEL